MDSANADIVILKLILNYNSMTALISFKLKKLYEMNAV